jgi:membrane protein implicated in regulation of membrane protease activity
MDTDQLFFLFIALFGAGFLFLSFILGELGDAFDSVGDFFGGIDGVDGADFDTGGVEHGADGPSPLSLRNLMAFLTAFGASGLITSGYGWGTLESSLFAIVPGLVLAYVAYKFMRALYGQESSSVVEVRSLVGSTGVVEVGLPPGGVGRVMLSTTGGGRSSFLARSEDGTPISTGESVVVKSTLGSDLVVSRAARTTAKE